MGERRESLTETQERILAALCRPLQEHGAFATPATNQEIADEVFLSVDAVKGHLRALYAKFGIESLPQNQKRARLAEIALAGSPVPEEPSPLEQPPRLARRPRAVIPVVSMVLMGLIALAATGDVGGPDGQDGGGATPEATVPPVGPKPAVPEGSTTAPRGGVTETTEELPELPPTIVGSFSSIVGGDAGGYVEEPTSALAPQLVSATEPLPSEARKQARGVRRQARGTPAARPPRGVPESVPAAQSCAVHQHVTRVPHVSWDRRVKVVTRVRWVRRYRLKRKVWLHRHVRRRKIVRQHLHVRWHKHVFRHWHKRKKFWHQHVFWHKHTKVHWHTFWRRRVRLHRHVSVRRVPAGVERRVTRRRVVRPVRRVSYTTKVDNHLHC
jgi:hypothetical protein